MTVQTSPDTEHPAGAAAALQTTAAIRDRARFLTGRARRGGSDWFVVDDAMLPRAADEVAAITRARFPDLRIPFHSRWRHFEVGGIDRTTALEAPEMVDLAVVSVLLDAGAGPDWSYLEADTGGRFARSEGLGVASWHAFQRGIFSEESSQPLRVDAAGLRALTVDRIADAFQVTPSNPLVGLDGRLALLHRLADAMTAAPDVFGADARPSGLLNLLSAESTSVAAHDILAVVPSSLSGIWLSHNVIGDQPVGDCWRHAAVPGPGLTAGWMPFHKLSQWLTYSLLEPFARAGVAVTGLDALTALPEYRNGGLLLDTGVLRLRDDDLAGRQWSAGDALVVEWRALTVALLDELAPLVRTELDVDEDTLPMACVLEGGTWAAGRALAQRLRGGLPPLSIVSDGTVF